MKKKNLESLKSSYKHLVTLDSSIFSGQIIRRMEHEQKRAKRVVAWPTLGLMITEPMLLTPDSYVTVKTIRPNVE